MWVQHESKTYPGQTYYYNTATGESPWQRPDVAPSSGGGGGGGGGPNSGKVHVLHILVKHEHSRRPSSWRTPVITRSRAAAVEEMRRLRASLADAPDLEARFRHTASHVSDCSSASRGGDLGPFGRGEMQPEFEEAAYALRVGQLSDLVHTASGVHILLRLA